MERIGELPQRNLANVKWSIIVTKPNEFHDAWTKSTQEQGGY